MKRVKIGSANARGFFFFLLITTVMAALIKLSKTYESTYKILVKVTEIPIDKTIQSISPEEIEVKVENSGFAILRNNWSTPEAYISFKSLNKNEADRTYQYSLSNNLSNIEHTLSDNLNLISVIGDEVVVIVDEMESKEIAIHPNVQLEYASGYRAKEELNIEPKLVRAVGPHYILDKLEVIDTELFVQKDVKDNVEVTVAIAIADSLQEVKFDVTNFIITQEVTKFTEGTVTVPITVLNNGNNKVKIFPKEVEVVYSVNLDDFENIKGKDFVVTCDFSNSSENNNYLPLTIKKQPKEVSLARLVDKQVQYLVID